MNLLGLAAPLVVLNGGNADVLGGGPRTAPSAYRLMRELGMVNAEDARARIEEKLRAARSSSNARPAWDLVRAAAWTGTAYRAHLLDAAAARELLGRAGTIARARYRSWKVYAADFIAGRRKFLGRPGRGKDDEAAAVARLLRAPSGPWQSSTWSARPAGALSVHVARVIRVGKRGDYSTIRAALASAAAGDVIEIAAGTYREALRPAVDIELVARGRVTITSHTAHTLEVDGVGVRTTGIDWIGTHATRGAVVVRDGGVLHLTGGSVRARADGLDVHDRGTLALLEDTRVHDCGRFGVSVVGDAWLHATGVIVERTARSGISVEQRGEAVLADIKIARAREVGLLVVEDSTASVRGGTIAHSGWANAQLSAGTLALEDCTLERGQTGVFVVGGRAHLSDVEVDAPSKNGIELGGEEARIHARGVTIARAGSSGALVAAGALYLRGGRIRSPRFDGVTALGGEAMLSDLRVTSPGRAALWLEPGSSVALSASPISAAAIVAQPGAHLSARFDPIERAVLPFTLVAHPRAYSLIADVSDFWLLAPKTVENGYDFTEWVQAELASDRALVRKLKFDPEASTFAVVATDRDTLVEVARRLVGETRQRVKRATRSRQTRR